MQSYWKQYIPILSWLTRYQRSELTSDISAGLTVGIILVPQGMAYALLAGVPPIYGLYAAIVPLLVYAILGTSRQLSVGPVAISSLLVLAGISQVAAPQTPEYLSLVILTGLLVGVVQLLMGVFRLGFLANFLSQPVIAGFSSAAAVIIATNQLKYLLGIDVPRFEYLFEVQWYCVKHLGDAQWLALAFGLGGMLMMLLLKKRYPKIPAALLAIIAATSLTYFYELDEQSLAIVGTIPEGLPRFYFPIWTWQDVGLVLPTVLTVSLMGVVECIGIAKSVESPNDDHRLVPDQELRAIGLSKIAGAFFQSIPTSGSFSRTAINSDSGGRTPISSIITALVIMVTLLFLTPLFYYLPEAILAAIILVAIRNLLDWKTAIKLWHHHRADFYMMLATFICTLIFSIEVGVLVGMGLSVAVLTYRSSRPHIAILGQLPDTVYYRNIERFDNAVQYEEVLMVRFDAHLYFTNATFFKEMLSDLVTERAATVRVFILDASSIHAIDASGLEALEAFRQLLKARQIEFYISGVIGPVRDLLNQVGLSERIGAANQFMNLHAALQHYLTRKKVENVQSYWTEAAVQHNVELITSKK